MNIVRYQRYPQTDLAAVLDRITSMQAEMDRVYNSNHWLILSIPSFVEPLESCS